MKKEDMVETMRSLGYFKGQLSNVINDVFLTIAEALIRDGKVFIRGFGTFEVKRRKGHRVQDVHTKEIRKMEDYSVVCFRPGENLKEAVKSGDVSKLSFLRKGE